MTRIRIELALDPEHVDEESHTGVSEEAYENLTDALNAFGEDVTIEKAV